MVRLPSGNDLLLPLLTGEVDAVAAATGSMLHNVARAQLADRVHAAQLTLEATEVAVLVRPDRPDLVTALDRAIGHAQKYGHLAALRDRWFEAPKMPLNPRERLALIAGVGALLVSVVGFILVRRRVIRRALEREERAGILEMALNATAEPCLWPTSTCAPTGATRAMRPVFPSSLP